MDSKGSSNSVSRIPHGFDGTVKEFTDTPMLKIKSDKPLKAECRG
jgi:hypothetical protein